MTMPIYLRVLLITCIAVLFGAAQTVCACTPSMTNIHGGQHGSIETEASSPDHMSHDMLIVLITDLPEGHGEDAYCQHCDGEVSAISGNGLLSNTTAPETQFKTSTLPPQNAYLPRPNMASNTMQGVGWLDPPGIPATPVSLKIRFLN